MSRPKNSLPGSVYFNKQRNNYTVSYEITDYENGLIKIKRKSFDNEEEAYCFLETLQNKQGNALYKKNNSIPLNELMKFLVNRKFNNGIIGEAQYCKLLEYISYIEQKASFAKKDISEISSEELQEYFRYLMKYSKSYMSKYINLIASSFEYALGKGFIKLNPLVDTVIPKSKVAKKKVRALTIYEQMQLTYFLKNVSISDEPYKNAFLFQLYLGLRIGEALALQSSDIDLTNNIITINKTLTVDKNGSLIMGDTTKTYCGERKIPIPNIIKNELIEQLDLSKSHFNNQLFVSKTGYYANPKSVNTILKRIMLNNFGIVDITSHSLRHTFATVFIAANGDPVALKALLGHSKIEMSLDNYVDAQDDFKNRELDKVSQFYENSFQAHKQMFLENNNILLSKTNFEMEDFDM